MWSAGSEVLYLGSQVVMLADSVQHHPAPTPMADVLLGLGKPKKRRLTVVLSGALCPATGFATPPQVRSWQERHAIAQAHAAEQLAILGPLHCETDNLHPHIAAALPVALRDEVLNWAASVPCTVAAMVPSWALATQCVLARKPQVRSVLLHEADSVTLLLEKTTALTLQSAIDDASLATIAQDWMTEHGLKPEQLLRLKFDTKAQTVLADGPLVLANHWQVF